MDNNDSAKGAEQLYIEYAEALSGVSSLEKDLHNKKRMLEEIKKNLSAPDCDGGFGTEVSAHAFRQIAERFEELALENAIIHTDVFKPDSPQESLLLASNLKSFIITLLASARIKGQFKKGEAANGGKEFRFTVDINSWSGDKTLQFVGIVQNNVIKTGFFNWV